jgi:hypothetical protein
MRESDGEPNNTTGLSWVEAKDIPSARSARPKRSLPLGAFPSLIVTQDSTIRVPSQLHSNNTWAQSLNFSVLRLEAIYQKLLDADIAIKTGRNEPMLALDLLVVELMR